MVLFSRLARYHELWCGTYNISSYNRFLFSEKLTVRCEELVVIALTRYRDSLDRGVFLRDPLESTIAFIRKERVETQKA